MRESNGLILVGAIVYYNACSFPGEERNIPRKRDDRHVRPGADGARGTPTEYVVETRPLLSVVFQRLPRLGWSAFPSASCRIRTRQIVFTK